MEKNEVQFLDEALDDLDEIVSYISRDNPAAAQRMKDKIIQNANDLSRFPDLGHKPRYPKMRKAGYRLLVVKPYVLFYKIIGSNIFIYRVIHGSRDWQHILSEET